MNTFEMIILAAALSIDALLVSLSCGLAAGNSRLKNLFAAACCFGFFQFAAPFAGWFLTGYVYNYLKVYSKLAAFGIFLILGLKFIKDAFCSERREKDCLSAACILGLSAAISIDAFCAGITFKLLDADILKASLIIGIVTFIMSEAGFYLSGLTKNFPQKAAEFSGGVLLIYLAARAAA